MNYNSLKATINANIKQNGNQEITGIVMNSVLNAMVNALAASGMTFGGAITPSTPVPTNIDQATAFLAPGAGTYEHFLDSNGDPIVVTSPSLIMYDGGQALIFTSMTLPFPQVLSVVGGNSLIIPIPDFKNSYRIDMTAQYTGGSEERYIGSLILEVNDLAMQVAHGYYYGYDMAEILSECAIWKNDPEFYPDDPGYCLLLTTQSDLDEVIFSVSSMDGKSVQMYESNEDEKVKVADATITPVGGGSSDVFVAEYRVTSASDIDNAIASGKTIFAKKNGDYYVYSMKLGNVYYFYSITNTTIYRIVLNNGVWQSGSFVAESASNKVSTISDNETDTTKYPNTKAVADALGKIGVISQTQTWTTEPALNTPGVYQMSNHNLGIIPQAFIDLAESIGAVFNPNGYQTGVGYFELNGLTDLSYEEMIDVYNLVGVVQNLASWGGTALRSLKKCPRTLPPVSNRANTQYPFNYAFRVATQGVEKTYIESIGIGTESTDLLISSGFSEMLYNANYLRYFGVNGALKPNSSAASFSLAFQNCHSLTSVRIYGLCQNIDFAGTYYKPAIDLASIVFMVENAANTAAITIKVSPTTYGYCQADTTEYTYQGNTYTGILALATAHNISIGQV